MSAPNHYEINVSLDGVHYFSTSIQSGQYWNIKTARNIVRDFRRRFTKHEGFEVSLTVWNCSGKKLDVSNETTSAISSTVGVFTEGE